MSVYEVSADHISYLVSLGRHLRVQILLHNGGLIQLDLGSSIHRTAVAAALREANLLSVGTQDDELREASPDSSHVDDGEIRTLTASQLCQALQWVTCYRYQSCEWPDWPNSLAHTYTDRLHAELVTKLIALHDTVWDYPTEKNADGRHGFDFRPAGGLIQ